jgi:endoglucanase
LTSQYFKVPTNYTNPIALQHHVYSPYDFVFSAWGKTIWGSDTDKQAIDDQIGWITRNFSGVPVVIGEYSASPTNCEAAARWKYHQFIWQTAAKYNQSVFLWDNGLD